MRKITKKSHFWSKKPPKMRPKIKKKRKKNVLEKNAKIRGGREVELPESTLGRNLLRGRLLVDN